MKVFLSIFKNEHCSSCNIALKLPKKRRECKVCRKSNIDKLFCTSCSIKVKKPHTLGLKNNRYCLACHSISSKSFLYISTTNRLSYNSEKSAENLEFSANSLENFENPEETQTPTKKEEEKLIKNKTLGLKQRLSKLIVKVT